MEEKSLSQLIEKIIDHGTLSREDQEKINLTVKHTSVKHTSDTKTNAELLMTLTAKVQKGEVKVI
ncbi:MAG: hypothetical protein PHC51_02745 [bacterium]|nr:hypothetical protein [bacterium]